jgi:hypothetical protein
MGSKIMLAFASLKHQLTKLKEITDLNRRIGPPVNKISYLEAKSYLPLLFTGGRMLAGPSDRMGNPDNISICICKTPKTGLREINDLNRRMGPPLNKI